MPDDPISLGPIGYVVGARERPDDTPIQSVRNPDEQARVLVLPELAEGLDGLADFDYAWLLTYLDRAPTEPELRVVPFLLRDSGRRVGVFATRDPGRPNPIALSLVRVLAVEDNVLHFAGVDLCHRTPVLDIKPWEQHLDIPGHRPEQPHLDRVRGGWYQSTGAAHTELGGLGGHQRDMAVRQRPGHLQLRVGIDEGLAFQDRLDGIDSRPGKIGQIRQGLLADPAIGLAERAPQQVRH